MNSENKLINIFSSIYNSLPSFANIITKYNTTRSQNDIIITGSLINKLSECDKILSKLQNEKIYWTKLYDEAVLNTNEIKSKYNNNLNLIQSKIDSIKLSIINFKTEINQLNLESNENILKALTTIINKSNDLKSNNYKLFDNIEVYDVNIICSYHKCIEENKQYLHDIAELHNKEQIPYIKLQEINSQITKIKNEIELIKQFQINHNKITSEHDQVFIPTNSQNIINDKINNLTLFDKQ